MLNLLLERTSVKLLFITTFCLHHEKVFGETTPSGAVAVQVREKVLYGGTLGRRVVLGVRERATFGAVLC